MMLLDVVAGNESDVLPQVRYWENAPRENRPSEQVFKAESYHVICIWPRLNCRFWAVVFLSFLVLSCRWQDLRSIPFAGLKSVTVASTITIFSCAAVGLSERFKLPMNDINALALGFVRPRLGKSSQNLVGGHASLLFKSLNFTLADTPYYIFYHVPSVVVTAILSVLISRLLDPPFAH